MRNNLEPRNEIEAIIKNHGISRNRFFEVDKFSYKSVLNRIISKFINIEESKGFDFNLHRGYLRYNPKLRCTVLYSAQEDWWQWFRLLPNLLNNLESSVYIVFVGSDYSWIYEGFLQELIQILYE